MQGRAETDLNDSTAAQQFAARRTDAAVREMGLQDGSMDSSNQRELVFWSFAQLLQKFMENIESHVAQDIPSALNWFLIMFVEKPIEASKPAVAAEPQYFYIRVLVFWSLRRLGIQIKSMQQPPPTVEAINTQLRNCLDLEPIIDLLPTIMIDVTEWLVLHDGKIIFLEDFHSSDAHNLFIDAWEDMFTRPYVTPHPDEQRRLFGLLRNTRTRSDLYSHVIKFINEHVSRMLILQKPLERNEIIIVHPQIKAMKLKAEWLMRFLCDNMHSGPPSQHILKVMVDMIEQVLLVYDPDPFSGLHDAAKTLQTAMDKTNEKLMQPDEPQLIHMERKLSYLTTLLAQKRLEAYQRRLGIEIEQPASNPLSRSESQTSSIDSKADQPSHINGKEVLVHLDNILVEIDPVVDRIVIPSLERGQQGRRHHTAADEVLMSITQGRLKITSKELLWFGIDKKYARQRPSLSMAELAINFPLEAIMRFTVGSVPSDEIVREREYFKSGQNDLMSLTRNMIRGEENEPPTTAHVRSDEFFISIFTQEEVFRFFPLSDAEASGIQQLLTMLTGLQPFVDSEFVKDVLTQKLSVSRHQVLKQLLLEPSPWIEESSSLTRIITNLTAEYQPQQVVDMERLFHSCRIEPEVTKETIIILRHLWADSPPEATQIKILAIIDRLLDKVVMQRSDPIFMVVHKWLRGLEQTISPYRSPTALALVSNLVRRCKAMLLEPLTPIVRSHAKSLFTSWDDYNYWLHLYNINRGHDDNNDVATAGSGVGDGDGEATPVAKRSRDGSMDVGAKGVAARAQAAQVSWSVGHGVRTDDPVLGDGRWSLDSADAAGGNGAGLAGAQTPTRQPSTPLPALGGGHGGAAAATTSQPGSQSDKRKRKPPNFSELEDERIERGFQLHGDNWEAIMRWGEFDAAVRTPWSLRNRWSRLQARKRDASRPGSPSLNAQSAPADADPAQLPPLTPSKRSQSASFLAATAPTASGMPAAVAAPATTVSAPSSTKKIDQYFPRNTGKGQQESLAAAAEQIRELQERLARADRLLADKELQCKALEGDLERARADSAEWQSRFEARDRQAREQETKMREALVASLREHARVKHRLTRRNASENSLRLASLTLKRKGIDFQDCWQEGVEFVDLQEKLAALNREREDVEKHKRLLARRDAATDDDAGLQVEEVAKLRLLSIKREETELLARLDRLLVERTMHIKECLRIRDEDESRFNSHPVLNSRYLLLEMIGRGGFSEVYRAFDLQECRFVACKIHSLSEQWTEERKQSYMRHSIREYHIQKSLDHPNIVRLYDVFDYDHYSFCTILEFVDGQNLETTLQQVKCFSEKEARSIVIQTVAALKYLNELERPIIHYDLKPGNILLHNGQVKITDFGLSKILDCMDEQENTRGQVRIRETDLTSQGAGTMWYLPPEVFERGSGPVKISSKVDVWSLGCVLYELLYGVKPFGHNKSQMSILHESVIASDAHALVFPPKPAVSQDAKDFLRRCLEYSKDRRPDVMEM
ncbi:Serine/threonine-protein kinase tousled-like 2 [Polyrhizophydium stewartii]|uniref:Serine/threonine-protein kinase tousled-like 2 n=1 Tax=Polyrhizophydium stewartii TaxID=2732419 RepID=A0ABR4MX14_9FUNG